MQTQRHAQFTLATPPVTLAAILEAGDARLGRTIVAHVDEETQALLGVRTLDTPTPMTRHDRTSRDAADRTQMELSDQLREIAEDMVPARTWVGGGINPIPGELYTVVCREGRVIDTLVEWQFMEAWHFSNHGTAAFSADTYVVTPHGWTGALDRRAGLEPRLDHGTSLL